MTKWNLIAGIVLTILILIVVLQNMQPVETRILFVTVTLPRATLAAVTMLAGILLGFLIRLSIIQRKRNKVSNLT